MAGLPVSVLVAGEHAALRAAREATASIPIVAIDVERDPVAGGFAQSLARPGGNVTGFFCDFPHDMNRLVLALREALPGATRMVALVDGAATEAQVSGLRTAGHAFALATETQDIAAAAPEALVDRIAAVPFIVLASARLERAARRLAKRALRRRLPSAGAFTRYAHVGGLLARGPSLPDTFRRAGAIVDRLLRGGSPGEMAVERPPRFELIVNFRTSAGLQIALAPTLVSRADHVVR
jgi:putative ABC transport system substrate-binding protein